MAVMNDEDAYDDSSVRGDEKHKDNVELVEDGDDDESKRIDNNDGLGSVVANGPDEPVMEESEEEKDTKAAEKLLRVHDIPSMTTKYGMCVTCLPCLKNGKL